MKGHRINSHEKYDYPGLVDVLLRMHGVQAFEEEEPADDFGLGIVYTAVRDALIEVGHLHPNEPLAPAPAC